jgi:hypothetical protein
MTLSMRIPAQLKSLVISAIGFCLFVFVQVAVAGPPNDVCDLPKDLQRELASKYPGAKLVRLSDLDKDDSALFQKEHGDTCPGLVKVDFYGDGKPTLALVLIAKDGAKEKAELVVAHQIAEKWSTALLDTAESSWPVVWRQDPGDYRDVYGEKTIRATRPVIVFCGYSSWAIVYAWTGKDITKAWIAD